MRSFSVGDKVELRRGLGVGSTMIVAEIDERPNGDSYYSGWSDSLGRNVKWNWKAIVLHRENRKKK